MTNAIKYEKSKLKFDWQLDAKCDGVNFLKSKHATKKIEVHSYLALKLDLK